VQKWGVGGLLARMAKFCGGFLNFIFIVGCPKLPSGGKPGWGTEPGPGAAAV